MSCGPLTIYLDCGHWDISSPAKLREYQGIKSKPQISSTGSSAIFSLMLHVVQIREIVVIFRPLALFPHNMLSALAHSRRPTTHGGERSTDVTLTPLTAKVTALLQREIPILAGVTGVPSHVGFAAAVAIFLSTLSNSAHCPCLMALAF